MNIEKKIFFSKLYSKKQGMIAVDSFLLKFLMTSPAFQFYMFLIKFGS